MSVFYTGRSLNTQIPAHRRGGVGAAVHRGLTLLRKNPRRKVLGKLLLTGAVAFALSPCAMGSLQLPILVGFLFSLKADWFALFAAALGCLGGAVFWQGDVLAELLAGAVAALLTVAILSGTELWKKHWIQSLICAAVTAALGLVFLLGGNTLGERELLELGVRTGFTALSQGVFRQAGEKKTPLALDGVLAFVTMGLCQIALLQVVDLGFVLGAALACTGESLPMALFCGLGLDLAGIAPVPMSAVLCLSSLGNKMLPNRRWGFLTPAVLSFAWGAAAGSFDPVLTCSLLIGGTASTVFSQRPAPEKKEVRPEEARLMAASTALGQLAESLGMGQKEISPTGLLFDQAAQAACEGCSRWHQCWEGEAEETYRDLAGAVPGLLAGQALPERFLHRCRRPEAFARGVRQGLDSLRLRQQYHSQLAESRRALTRQYENLSRFLLELAMPTRSDAPCQYQAEVGHSTAGAFGKGRSGDRVAWFSAPQNRFYVLLCDGMGTGREAAKAGQQALELLRGLLTAGMEPEAALVTLNDYYVLKEAGGLSTADILELRLDTGRAALYKWGGAPSYLKHRRSVKKIGTAAPPPGIGIGDDHRPEVIRLSMQRGQMMVLVSDGLAGEDLPDRIAGCADGTPQVLAESLTLGTKALAEDDCTAVAVCLSHLQAGLL